MNIKKNKWKLVGDTYFTIERINTEKNTVVTYPTIATVNTTFISDEEAKANALLISKAPEMLEMLNRVEKILTYETIEPNSPIQLEIFQLIKEATEL